MELNTPLRIVEAVAKVAADRDQLLAALKELLSAQTIEGLRSYTGIMDICVTCDEVRAGLEAIAYRVVQAVA